MSRQPQSRGGTQTKPPSQAMKPQAHASTSWQLSECEASMVPAAATLAIPGPTYDDFSGLKLLGSLSSLLEGIGSQQKGPLATSKAPSGSFLHVRTNTRIAGQPQGRLTDGRPDRNLQWLRGFVQPAARALTTHQGTEAPAVGASTCSAVDQIVVSVGPYLRRDPKLSQ